MGNDPAVQVRQLEALLAVAEHGTFSAAADALHTVQSNISAHIARLEGELGAVLVDRRTGALTEAGEAAVVHARRVAAELRALSADVAAVGTDSISGPARLGIIGTTARWLVPFLLPLLQERHPGIRLVVVDATTTSLEPQVASGAVDLAIVNVSSSRRPHPELVADALFDEDLVLVVPDGHPLADRAVVDLADLHDAALLLPPAGTAYRAELDAAARAAGVSLRAQAELDGVRLIASLTMEGHGCAILPATALPVWLTGPWQRIDVTGLPRRSVGVARPRRGRLAAPAEALLGLIHDAVEAGSSSVRGIRPPAVPGRPTGR